MSVICSDANNLQMIAFLLPEPDMDPVADKASNDGANVRPTPFDSHGK
eukprot:gene5454-8906_t